MARSQCSFGFWKVCTVFVKRRESTGREARPSVGTEVHQFPKALAWDQWVTSLCLRSALAKPRLGRPALFPRAAL